MWGGGREGAESTNCRVRSGCYLLRPCHVGYGSEVRVIRAEGERNKILVNVQLAGFRKWILVSKINSRVRKTTSRVS